MDGRVLHCLCVRVAVPGDGATLLLPRSHDVVRALPHRTPRLFPNLGYCNGVLLQGLGGEGSSVLLDVVPHLPLQRLCNTP